MHFIVFLVYFQNSLVIYLKSLEVLFKANLCK